MGELHNFKGVGATIKLSPAYSICNYLGDKQNTTKMQAT